VDRRGPAEARAAVKRGTEFRYTLSEPARVVFALERRRPGRRVRGKRRRARWVKAGSFAVQGAAGANRKKFSGRIGRRRLRPGSYRLSLVATDAAGNRSVPKRLAFRVTRG
jgi:hypothetical protein